MQQKESFGQSVLIQEFLFETKNEIKDTPSFGLKKEFDKNNFGFKRTLIKAFFMFEQFYVDVIFLIIALGRSWC